MTVFDPDIISITMHVLSARHGIPPHGNTPWQRAGCVTPALLPRAIRKAGELLQKITPAHGANQNIQEGDRRNVTRTDAARDAGFSEHQQKQALRRFLWMVYGRLRRSWWQRNLQNVATGVVMD